MIIFGILSTMGVWDSLIHEMDEITKNDAVRKLNKEYNSLLNPDYQTILVFGGSQGAATINRVIPETIPLLNHKRIQIIHLTGKKDLDKILKSMGNPFKSIIKLGIVEQYLLDDNQDKPLLCNILKKNVDRVELKTASVYEVLKELPNDSITKFSISNIFDWVGDDEFKRHLTQIIRVGKNKGKIFYSATRNDRGIPKNIKEIHSKKQVAFQLLEEDRTTMYSNFLVGKICK